MTAEKSRSLDDRPARVSDLTAFERRVLAAEGLGTARVQGDVLRTTADAEAQLLREALDTAAAAAELGVGRSRVRQLLAARRLHGFKQGHVWRLPLWQFQRQDKGTIPGIGQVICAMPADIHPLSARGSSPLLSPSSRSTAWRCLHSPGWSVATTPPPSFRWPEISELAHELDGSWCVVRRVASGITTWPPVLAGKRS